MAGDVVKLKLKDGSREIELEGPIGDVDKLLVKWWGEAPEGSPAGLGGQRKPPAAARARNARRSPVAGSGTPPDGSFDANEIANRVKDSQDFGAVERRILHVDGDAFHKVAFPIWFVNQPLTSGAIHKILGALHVKISLPGVSKALERNIKNFTTSKRREQGGPPAAYQLTAKARAEFETWLRSSNE